MNFKTMSSLTGTVITFFTGLSVAFFEEQMIGLAIIGLLMFNAGLGFELLERTQGEQE